MVIEYFATAEILCKSTHTNFVNWKEHVKILQYSNNYYYILSLFYRYYINMIILLYRCTARLKIEKNSKYQQKAAW